MHGHKIPNLGDITKVDNIGGSLQIDILYWTPPCQDISIANTKRKGNKRGSKTRSSLAFEIPRILANTPPDERPRYLVMEEVPSMVNKAYKSNFDELLKELSKLNYNHKWGILNACDYGIAQSRRRCFVISKLGGSAPNLPKKIPLNKCFKDYLESEPVDYSYYLTKERIKNIELSAKKEIDAGNGFIFKPSDGRGIAYTVTPKPDRKTGNYLLIPHPNPEI